jgi:drug/metabolite transporter (DMT)-like permease
VSKNFYINQAVLFLTSAVCIALLSLKSLKSITPATVIYGVIFGIVTFLAQWCYTLSLNKGPTSICAMIYAFGFIFPTVSGFLFWDEPFKYTVIFGILAVILSIVLSSVSFDTKTQNNRSFIFPALIAMASAGGLGIIQKIHQGSADKENLGAFLIIAFIISAAISLAFSLLKCNKTKEKIRINRFSVLAGFCFGIVSMLNTLLAGRMPSTVLFPTLNIGVMMACFVAGILVFKEKPSKCQMTAFLLGILAVIILSL